VDKKTVLLIDDDPDITFLVESCLRSFDLDVVVARSGKDAMRCLKERKPRIVLLDITLPDINGYSILRYIRQKEAATSDVEPTSVIIQSGRGLPTEILCETEGISAFVRKPYDIGQVLRAISDVLQGGGDGKKDIGSGR